MALREPRKRRCSGQEEGRELKSFSTETTRGQLAESGHRNTEEAVRANLPESLSRQASSVPPACQGTLSSALQRCRWDLSRPAASAQLAAGAAGGGGAAQGGMSARDERCGCRSRASGGPCSPAAGTEKSAAHRGALQHRSSRAALVCSDGVAGEAAYQEGE